MKYPITAYFLNITLAASALLASCGGEKAPVEVMPDEEKTVTEETSVLKVDDRLIVLPSPVQMSGLIQKSGAAFKKDLLSSTANSTKYTTVFQQAMNMGVYGADAGYASAFGQSQVAMDYMGAVGKLSDQLDLNAAFGNDIIQGLKAGGSKEAMMGLVATAYKSCDELLDKNERTDVAAMIAAGAWIESMYCAVEAYKASKSQALSNCIGDQKSTLNNLISLISGSFKRDEQPDFANVVDTLSYIAQEYNNVYATYNYVATTDDAGNKKSTINSTNEVTIKEETIERISAYLTGLRQKITN
ncbi:MAG: hypothetical protein KDD36_13355 [Flavobacteriales bacterium]|nr:hypothetical protein [Flavobacteriales bacterium]